MEPFHSVPQEAIDHISSMIASGQIQDHYPLLGEGLSGKVYEFERFAVKVFKEDSSERQDHWILNQLQSHPSFPTLYHYEDQFMVMDKVNGFTMAQVMKSGENVRDSYYTQIEDCVEHCYRQGIIAKDLHLNNIMIDQNNHIKIVDVGRFHSTDQKKVFHDRLTEDLEDLKYCLFSYSSSKRRKRRRHRRYKSSSSYSRSYSYSSRSYSSSRRKYRKTYKKIRKLFST
ncbi:protein kinase domain-containing protein [Melghirimyces algeriensis]|uniref:Protein kinase domain-containing protein n=1 Tax=Melghirimyces algeriensis TaxID=910412 RepID=A0A521EFA6_9BACL|nr:AarF/UbiB family protein [Melghirimyces algeriensis]SMO82578.1 Protein kinase domain-containing protein [Melghirimyces algeriensis]